MGIWDGDLFVPAIVFLAALVLIVGAISIATHPQVCTNGSHKETQDTVMWVDKSMLIIPEEVTVCNE